MHMKDDNTDESGNVDKFDPVIESLAVENETFPIHAGLPIDEHGNVPSGLAIEIRRTTKAQHARGLTFYTTVEGKKSRIMFAEPKNWNSSGSHEELLFSRGAPPEMEACGKVDMHRWLHDQTSPVKVTDAHNDAVALRRPGKLATEQDFMHQGHKYLWQRARGADDKDRSLFTHHLECSREGAAGEVYAIYTTRSEDEKKHTGVLEVKAKDLKPELVEVILMTCMAVFVQLQKRTEQEEKAGIMGKLANSALFSVGK